MSNVWELAEYFLKTNYKVNINKSNPLGAGGNIANAYANLMKNMWYESSSVVSPWNFKKAIAKFAP